jgi:hypothetical protein
MNFVKGVFAISIILLDFGILGVFLWTLMNPTPDWGSSIGSGSIFLICFGLTYLYGFFVVNDKP